MRTLENMFEEWSNVHGREAMSLSAPFMAGAAAMAELFAAGQGLKVKRECNHNIQGVSQTGAAYCKLCGEFL